ncbi:hypothetical protein RD792_008689 [Penstemon davidsonii]|uniref:Membralin n=1 Tax=Penstemon davidsonii TaxID=160366 RepID=A0ABR0D9X4_9LAMI|nr:hypothetical protein RD792_008689 [Penstemon davidsonii]
MDQEQTFMRVQERFSEMVTPKIRVALEYFFFFIAIILFCVLVVMHANYVQQPGCSTEFSRVKMSKAQLIQIKITSAGLWSHNESAYDFTDIPESQTEMDVNGLPVLAADSWLTWITSEIRRGKSLLKFWKTENDVMESQREASITSESFNSPSDDVMVKDIAGINLNFDIPKWLRILHLDRLNSYAGYLYNYQTKEFYNLTYAHEQPQSAAKFGGAFTVRKQELRTGVVWESTTVVKTIGNCYQTDSNSHNTAMLVLELEVNITSAILLICLADYLVTKCGVLMMSFFVFFTTTMSVSFTLRETQTRMLKFTVQLHHHARHRLPTFQLIFVHVIESLVFVPVSFSYLALSTSAAFMQHLILYFWNRFEGSCILWIAYPLQVPALQRFMQNRRSDFQQHPDFHITSSTILASTLRITRLNTRNSGPEEGTGNENRDADIGRQAVNANPGAMNPFGSLLGAATFSESLNSFLSIFRDSRDQGQFYGEPPPLRENHTTSNNVE